MSCQTFVILAVCAVCALTLSLVDGRPQKRSAPIVSTNLANAVNKTLCPIIIETNTMEGRIPLHIKLIKCDQKAVEECSATQPEGNCCTRVGSTLRGCTQLEEYVPVSIDNTITTFKAQVGCVCMSQDGLMAEEVGSS